MILSHLNKVCLGPRPISCHRVTTCPAPQAVCEVLTASSDPESSACADFSPNTHISLLLFIVSWFPVASPPPPHTHILTGWDCIRSCLGSAGQGEGEAVLVGSGVWELELRHPLITSGVAGKKCVSRYIPSLWMDSRRVRLPEGWLGCCWLGAASSCDHALRAELLR